MSSVFISARRWLAGAGVADDTNHYNYQHKCISAQEMMVYKEFNGQSKARITRILELCVCIHTICMCTSTYTSTVHMCVFM